MINQKEHLANFIVKNLIFVSLFVVFSFYGISFLLLPKINDFKEQQLNFRDQQILESRINEKNQQIQNQIQESKKQNYLRLKSLQTSLNPEKIQLIAQDFFQSPNIEEVEKQNHDIFVYTTYKITGQSTGITTIFDFMHRLQEKIPNSNFTLPIMIQKPDRLSNSLQLTIHLKIIQLRTKTSKKF